MAELSPEMHIIAHIRSDFPTKFGIPRQSGIVDGLVSSIVFENEYRNADALRGIEDFSHLWLIWLFSENVREKWSPTVRPPRLGGNKRMGVFSTRSPFRPNPIGLSSVRLLSFDSQTPDGPVLYVEGADLMDRTPIIDIKPYIPYTDSHPDAVGGFADKKPEAKLFVTLPENAESFFGKDRLSSLTAALAQDPRPAYRGDCDRIYGMPFAGHDVRFKVKDGVLTVVEIV